MSDTPASATQLNSKNDEWRLALRAEIAATEKRFIGSKTLWNFWYYLGLYLTIILPALAALVLKTNAIPEAALKNDLGAAFAALGAIVATAMTTGNFRKRWATSRVARTELHSLRVEVLRPDSDLAVIADNLKKTIAKYNSDVVDSEN